MNAHISSVERVVPFPGKDAGADHYVKYGYAMVRSLVPRSQIQEPTALYAQQVVPSKYPFFRQNTNVYEPNKLSARGYRAAVISRYPRLRAIPAITRAIFSAHRR